MHWNGAGVGEQTAVDGIAVGVVFTRVVINMEVRSGGIAYRRNNRIGVVICDVMMRNLKGIGWIFNEAIKHMFRCKITFSGLATRKN